MINESQPPLNGIRKPIAMKDGPCLWCGKWVKSGREIAGATNPLDPAWHDNGDFGCDYSPESTVDGCGCHARPYDLAIRIIDTPRLPQPA